VKLRFELTRHRKSICDVAERIPGTIAEMVLSQPGLGFGWDLNIDENGDCETSAFTFEMNENAAGAAIGINTFSKEDFNWIFRECGAVDGEVKTMKDDFFHDNVYLFNAFSKEETRKLFNYIYSNHSQLKNSWFDSDYDYNALVEALKEAGGAGVRLICYSKDGETLAGKAFIRMRGMIPLRARSLLRMLTPGITIAEVPETVDSLQDAIASDSISWESFCGCMDDMLQIYMNAAIIQSKREKEARTANAKISGERRDYFYEDYTYEDDFEEEEEDDDELYDELEDDMDDLSDLLNEDGSADTSYMEKLQKLIGLKDVKEQVQKITAYARMKQDFEKRGIPSEAMALNMEFTGNPGTAKTTVARILAGLFYEIGLTESEDLVEVGRSDLVAEYVGQTAIKVKGVFDRAKGKVLFIDEA